MSAAPSMTQQDPGSVGRGLLFTFLLHFCQIVLMPVIIGVTIAIYPDKSASGFAGFLVGILGFGITQLVYMIPAILIFKKRGQTKTGLAANPIAGRAGERCSADRRPVPHN